MIKTKITKNLSVKKGYTLVELSIAILIISLLMAGVFSMLTGSINNSKATLTTQRVNQIYKSMGTYLMVNKRLPCPASILTSKIDNIAYGQEVGTGAGCVGAGVYQSSTSGNLFFGGVPIKALNLSSEYAEDGYGNKLNYFIDRRFTYNFVNPGSPTSDSFGTLSSVSNIITVQEKQANATFSTLSTDVIFFLFSGGFNGFGSFSTDNATQNALATDDAKFSEDIENQVTNFNNAVSPPTASFNNVFITNSYVSDEFDDVSLYKTRIDFVNDFSASNLIYCSGSAITDADFPQKNLYYGQYLYASSACVAPNQSLVKIIRCGFDGFWQYVLANCP
jgi:prepilin-type N-terminal cleavage/methylation domain-containing protein